MKIKTSIAILLLIILAFFAVAARCFYLQHYRADDYRKISLRAQRSSFTEKPRRGAILDCRGRTLAASLRLDTVFAEPRAVVDLKKTSQQLAVILDIDPEQIESKIANSRNPGYVALAKNLSLTDEKRTAIRKIIGLGIAKTWKRYYPLGPAAAHAIGFVGSDGIGLAGIELKYDSLLGGTIGQSTFFADAARRPIGVKHFGSFAVDGPDLVLTIDATIQAFTHLALKKQMIAFEAESAFAVVMDPCTSAVLAMVSLPDFDPTDLSTADANSLGNHIISDPFEPGSIFKPIVAACAIDCGSIKPDDIIFCEDGHYSGKGFGRIGEYKNGFGDLSIKRILAVSSNIGMAKIGQATGAENIYNGIKLFGFGSRTGIDLLGEEPGLVWPVKRWNGYSIARIPYGHEVLVTGMQIASAYCVMANGGKISRPHLAKALLNNTNKKVKIISPPPLGGYIIDTQTADWMVKTALTEVVNAGTGKRTALEDHQVWGKTGTANIAKSHEKGYDQQNYVASFAGGVPADNPKLVILVSVRKPNRRLGKGYTGGSVAAPAVKEILQKTMTYLESQN